MGSIIMSKKIAHTPGPWKMDLGVNENIFTCLAETNRHSIHGIYEPKKAEDREAAYALDEANARLITAAPDMLAALEGIAATFELGVGSSSAKEAVLEAIAKAKNEA